MLELYNLCMIKQRNEKIKFFIKEAFSWKNIKLFLLLMVLCVITIFSWNINLKINSNIPEEVYAINDSYSGNPIKYTVKTFINAFIGNYEYTDDELSVKNLYNNLFEKNYYSLHPFGLSALAWIAIFMALCVLIYSRIQPSDRKKFAFFMFSIFVGTFIYILFLQVSYILKFADREAVLHNSLQRYMGTFLTMILCVISGVYINYLSKYKSNVSKYILILSMILFFTPISAIANSTIVAGVYNKMQSKGFEFDINISNRLSEVLNQDTKMYPIHQTSDQDTHLLRLRYFLTPYYIPITEKIYRAKYYEC